MCRRRPNWAGIAVLTAIGLWSVALGWLISCAWQYVVG